MDQEPLFGESYHSFFNPKAYLKERFSDAKCSRTRTLPLKPIFDFYKSYSATRPDGLTVLDVGCGPVIAYVVSATQYASEIVMAEYTESNRREITKWLNKHEDAHDWAPYLEYIVSQVEERSTEEVAKREEKLRSTIKAVVPCDLTKCPMMSSEYMKEYDVVQTFLCIEPASADKKMYSLIFKADLVTC